VKAAARRLALPLAVGLAALALWDSFVVYPFRVFVVFLHEISHGLAAVLTGGRILAIGLTFDEGGVCVTEGGSRFLILNAGYLGSLLFGVLFLLLGLRRRQARRLVVLVGAFTLMVTLLYVRTLFGVLYGLGAGAALLLAATRLPAEVSEVLLASLGVVSCLYAVWDVASDVLFRDAAGSDASALALVTGIPAVLWGVAWVGVSVVTLGLTLRRLAAGRAVLALCLSLLPILGVAEEIALEVIPLRNRPAETLVPVIAAVAPPGVTITGLDTRLIVRGTPSALAEVRRLAAVLDTPLRSLSITVDQGHIRRDAVRAGGATVEARPGRTVVTGAFDQRESSETGSGVQRVRALEGTPASIQVGRSVPVAETVVVPTPGGAAVVPGAGYREAVSGFRVLPRLSGDVVTLEILTADESVDDRGAVEGTRSRITVSGRLGQWIELGAALQDAEASHREVLGGSHERSLEGRSIRVMVEEAR